MKMIFFVVLGLTTVLGVKSEFNCSIGPPACFQKVPFPDEPVEQYLRTGKPLPSNEFFKAICPTVIKLGECIEEYDAWHCLDSDEQIFDYVILYNSVTEFCNEESDIRKGYVAHVDCVNNINFTSQACLITLKETIDKLRDETEHVLDENDIARHCLVLHLLKSCAVEMTEDFCGKEAGQTADGIMTGIENIFRCSGITYEGILDKLNSKIENLI